MRTTGTGVRPPRGARPSGGRGARARGRLSRAAVLALAVLQVFLVGCGDGGSGPVEGAEETISRETFVATYVDLRLATLRDTTATIDEEERERVLRDHGVTRADLLRFVEVHGERAQLMREVWDEVDERLRRARTSGDTASS